MSKDDDSNNTDTCCSLADTAVLSPPIDDSGTRVVMRHTPDGGFTTSLSRPLRDGTPIDSDSRLLVPREDGRYSVEPILGDSGSKESKGPAKVNSAAFRAGWDNIFGAKVTTGQA